MSTINEESIKLLENLNDSTIYVPGVNILITILDNIIREPENSKYRSIRLENKIIKNKLLVINGIRKVLFDIGFEENQETLTLPSHILIIRLKRYKDYIHSRLVFLENKTSLIVSPQNSLNDIPKETKITGAIKKQHLEQFHYKSFSERTKFVKVLTTNNIFLNTLEDLSDLVMQYEDKELQNYGRSLIPIEKLKDRTLEHMRGIQKLILKDETKLTDPCYNDLFLIEFTEWFNKEFFTWVNRLKCDICGAEIEQKDVVQEQNVRCERYICCNKIHKFYRFNDVAVLLKTRRGRCGEYANCFTFLCRCLGYDARYIYATFDHVWTEVFSVKENRWLHYDPSENKIDVPLIYEHGWNSNINYIIAFSCDDVQDVTWRYSNQHKKIKSKRNKCTELNLLNTILQLRNKRQVNVTASRRKYLKKRVLQELVYLMLERPLTEDERRGRTSGSLKWRLSRGEQKLNVFFMFKPEQDEVKFRQFNLRYSCAKNMYDRYIITDSKKLNIIDTYKNWEYCVFLSENIARKEELDWKMVYLARTEDTDNASITWSFDFSEAQLLVKTFNMVFDTKVYETGDIKIAYLDNNNVEIKQHEIINKMKFNIKVTLTGGCGDVSWQHTQLFRQELKSILYPFVINISFH